MSNIKQINKIINSLVEPALFGAGFNAPTYNQIRNHTCIVNYMETNLPEIELTVRSYKDYQVNMVRNVQLMVKSAENHFKENRLSHALKNPYKAAYLDEVTMTPSPLVDTMTSLLGKPSLPINRSLLNDMLNLPNIDYPLVSYTRQTSN